MQGGHFTVTKHNSLLTTQTHKGLVCGRPHMLQDDASDDGAPTQQQGQQADERHQHIKELPGVVLR